MSILNVENQSKAYVSIKESFNLYDIDIKTKKMNKDILSYYTGILNNLIDKQFNLNERLKVISNFRITQRKVLYTNDYPRIIFNYNFTNQFAATTIDPYSTWDIDTEAFEKFGNNDYSFSYTNLESRFLYI